MQEADLRLTELKKATYEFDRDVLRGSVNPVCVLDTHCVCMPSYSIFNYSGPRR